MAVQDDEVALCNHALELDPLAWVLGGHPFEVRNESLLAVTNMRVVLNVRVACVSLDSFARFGLVEHEVVERSNRFLVLGLSVTDGLRAALHLRGAYVHGRHPQR